MAVKKINPKKDETVKDEQDVVIVVDGEENTTPSEEVEETTPVESEIDPINEEEVTDELSPENEEEIAPVDPVEDVVVVEETEPEVTLIQNTNKPLESKKVKVKLKADHKCNIGGEWYYFSKGGTYTVPENVKNILVEADLLLPL